jgi:uncharacterized protein (UPF0261 family)
MSLSIVIVGTLDTKGEELSFFRTLVEKRGHRTVLIDCSILGKGLYRPDITPQEVASAAGETLSALQKLGDEAKAVERMAAGVSKIVSELYQSGKVDAIFALGGTMGAFLGLSAMKVLPLGLPKVMLSTVTLTQFIRAEMAPADVTLMAATVDLWGINTVTARMLETACAMVCGAAEAYEVQRNTRIGLEKPLVGVTTMGTAVCRYLPWLKPLLEKRGYEVLIFHTIGIGGRCLEQVIGQGWVSGVCDLATNELINEVCGGSYIAGPERLEVAGRAGIPQVISVGGCEAFGWGKGMETLPAEFKNRTIQLHSKLTFAVKASEDEMAAGGKLIAEKLNRSRGPTAVVLPLRGTSEREKLGAVFYDPAGRAALFEALKAHLSSRTEVIELDMHINDQSFSKTVVRIFSEMMEQRREPNPCQGPETTSLGSAEDNSSSGKHYSVKA